MKRKKVVMFVLFLIAVSISIWGYPMLSESLETKRWLTEQFNKTPRWFVVSFIPGVMLLTLGLQFFFEKFGEGKKSYKRVESSIGSILTTTQVVLVIVHALVISYGCGLLSKLNFIPSIVTGISFMVTGNYLPRFRNGGSWVLMQPGGLSKINEEAMEKILTSLPRIFVISGFLMILTIFLPSNWILFVFFAILFISVISIIGSIIYTTMKR